MSGLICEGWSYEAGASESGLDILIGFEIPYRHITCDIRAEKSATGPVWHLWEEERGEPERREGERKPKAVGSAALDVDIREAFRHNQFKNYQYLRKSTLLQFRSRKCLASSANMLCLYSKAEP